MSRRRRRRSPAVVDAVPSAMAHLTNRTNACGRGRRAPCCRSRGGGDPLDRVPSSRAFQGGVPAAPRPRTSTRPTPCSRRHLPASSSTTGTARAGLLPAGRRRVAPRPAVARRRRGACAPARPASLSTHPMISRRNWRGTRACTRPSASPPSSTSRRCAKKLLSLFGVEIGRFSEPTVSAYCCAVFTASRAAIRRHLYSAWRAA